MTKKEIEQVHKVLGPKIGQEWIEKLGDKVLFLILMRLSILKKVYPDKNKKGYQSNSTTLIYPKFKDLFKPFQLCPPDKLKAVIIGSQPYNNGEATGLLFQLSPFEYKAENTLPYNQQDVDCIDECVGLNKESPDPFYGVDWEALAKQGVLLLHSSWTVESFCNLCHLTIWEPVMKQLLFRLFNNDNTIVFMGIGDVANKLLASIPSLNSYIAAPNAFFHPTEDRLTFRKFKPFQRLNKALEKREKEKLIF